MGEYNFIESVNREINAHRTIPFWSWNGELDSVELKEQIRRMKTAGIGGYFMHARGGLTTPYMGDKWMEAIASCLDEGESQEMESWAYDENGWPSGFADGEVPRLGEAYQQKGLGFQLLEDDFVLPEHTLGVYRLCGEQVCRTNAPAVGDVAVYVITNRYYIDALNAEAITRFLECCHQRYLERFPKDFGSRLKGFFTDEPQYANGRIPWSPVLETAFAQEWGYDLREKLGAFFIETDGEKAFRWQYYRTAARLFREGFIKQMGDWCHDHGVQLTGHMMSEENLVSQLHCTGGVMPNYEYFDMPGVDWLGRAIASPVIPKQLGSASAQLGKRRTLTESFALCGWDVSFNELRWIAQWQFVNGVNLVCQHLSAYSLEGLRKRDYPASLHTQMPWFEEYKPLQDYFARTCAALAQGQDSTDVLLLQPLGDAAGNHIYPGQAKALVIAQKFDQVTTVLSGLHVLHHYGDEVLMERHGRVENGRLWVGKQSYRAVVLPYCESLAPSTAALLAEFIDDGGQVLAIGTVPLLVGFAADPDWETVAQRIPMVANASDAVAQLYNESTPHLFREGQEEQQVHIMQRTLPDGRMLLYLASLSLEALGQCNLQVMGNTGFTEYDPLTGEERVLASQFDGQITSVNLTFAPAQSYLLISCKPDLPVKAKMPIQRLTFAPEWEVSERTQNAMTLDIAEYRVNNGAWQPPKAIILIQKELLKRKEPCHIDLRLRFTINELDKIHRMALVMERPELYTLTLNGRSFVFTDEGYYCDKAFRCCTMRDVVREGENILVLSGEFFQRQKVYDVLFGENVHEVERNKLTYDTELESLYLLGDFSVSAADEPKYADRRAVWAGQHFTLCPQTDCVDISDITTRGYWFFSGRLRVRQMVTVVKQPDIRYVVEAKKLNVPVAKVYVNGTEAGALMLAPFIVDVTDLLTDGENQVEIELFTGNRNLLGPHHRARGESYFVAPSTFTDACDWERGPVPYWRDDFCFVTTGIIFEN